VGCRDAETLGACNAGHINLTLLNGMTLRVVVSSRLVEQQRIDGVRVPALGVSVSTRDRLCAVVVLPRSLKDMLLPLTVFNTTVHGDSTRDIHVENRVVDVVLVEKIALRDIHMNNSTGVTRIEHTSVAKTSSGRINDQVAKRRLCVTVFAEALDTLIRSPDSNSTSNSS